MKQIFQIFLVILLSSITFSIYADPQPQTQNSDASIRKMTREEVIISSHTESSPGVIGGVIMHSEYRPPSSSSSNVSH